MRLAPLGLVLALSLPIAAQDDDAAAAGERTRALLAGLGEVDERLLGTTRFTIYVQNTVKLGEMTLAVERHADAAQGAYSARLEATVVAGGNRFENLEELVLGNDLGVRSGKRRKSEQSAEKTKHETQALSSAEGKVELRRSRGEAPEETAEVALAGPNHCSLASLLLLARQLDPKVAATYLFQATRWKDGEAAPVVAPTRLAVRPAAKKVKRGEAEVELTEVEVLREGESDMTFLVDAERRLVELTDDSNGIRFVVGDAAPAAGPAAGGADPLAPVMTYLRVLAKAEPVEALDGALDWVAVYEGMVAENEEIKKEVTAEQLAELLRQQFAKAEAAITVDQVEILKPFLEVKQEGDTAEVVMPGSPAPFKLKRSELGWKITYFPH